MRPVWTSSSGSVAHACGQQVRAGVRLSLLFCMSLTGLGGLGELAVWLDNTAQCMCTWVRLCVFGVWGLHQRPDKTLLDPTPHPRQ